MNDFLNKNNIKKQIKIDYHNKNNIINKLINYINKNNINNAHFLKNIEQLINKKVNNFVH